MKWLIAAVMLGLVASALAAADAKCDGLARFKITHQYDLAVGDLHDRMWFGVKLFDNFFHDHPESRALFKRVRGDNVYSPEFEAHAMRVLNNFGMVIGLLDDQDTLVQSLKRLKEQHKERGVKPEYFDYFRDEFMQLLPEHLGDHVDWDAWMACFGALSAGLKAT